MAKSKRNFKNGTQEKREHFPRKAREKSLINLEQIAVVMDVLEEMSEVENEKTNTGNKKQRRITNSCRQVESSSERKDTGTGSVKHKKSKKPPLLPKTNGLSHFMELGARTDLIDSHSSDPLGPDSFDNFQWVEVKQELPDDIEVCKITYTELPLKIHHLQSHLPNDEVNVTNDVASVSKEKNKDVPIEEYTCDVPSKNKNNVSSEVQEEQCSEPDINCDEVSEEHDVLGISLNDDNTNGSSSEDESLTEKCEPENIEEIQPRKKRKKYLQQCDICSKKLHSKGNLRLHKLKVHKVKVQFSCELCPIKFDFHREAVQHRNSVHRGEDGRFGCDVCSKRITDYHLYLTHVRSHTDCGNTVTDGNGLHTDDLRGRLKSQDKNFICDTCGRRFAFSCLLRDHINTHTGVKPYLCQECGKAFCQKSTLKQHTKTHNEVRPFQCAECPQGFYSKGDFVKHQRTHTGERPYVCEVCGEGFSRSSHLVIHRRTHTGERPHVCDVCGRGFAKRGDVVRHHRVHTGELPYLCQVCGKAFRQSTQCANHIKSQHPDSPAPVARNPNPLVHVHLS
ncbi:histone-lysine N-methyltransferase PRDM9-like [Macrosteles quadrilineatus]|uniref:histone-lysine N-methyltransferase PRDM9-like n=1 Tax=Macrosteles quadrilineatus TaxID=74068 RepID=UPI0023E1EEA9|nr:histone-lysine N-methyltransferase PRDM9-like [Macrosteles quadrilineatus]XP_054275972.1 histone-lysine N-methyltransferase PRDM9-like [Macrosteles quadrilineatus]XP_054275973.1 histone-lysine N-methyltransferase PRDM9-like [Macrosteles quadrilineatus]